ncbi:MAG TPA: DUF6629 family protein, partial [Bacteroidia bacterium]|nr:DUF6629 family protein [Bacteroidia bacterium]
MCFSAGASFTSGAVLAVAGVASFRNAKSVSQKLFASIPLIFSIQQITEGFLWLSLGNNNMQGFQSPCTLIFLIIAQVIWPVWVPLSVGLLEKKESRKKIFFVLTFIGGTISAWISYCLFNFHVSASIDGYHIAYKLDFPASIHMVGGVSYFIVTVFSPLFSSVKKMPLLGALILAS